MKHDTSGHRRLWLIVALAAMVCIGAMAGCSGQRFHKSPWLVTKRDAARYIQRALEAENPDDRRDALVCVGETRYADHDTVIKASGLIARTDPSVSVRCAAVRLVAESLRSDAPVTLLRVLNPDGDDTTDSRVATDVLRGLYFLARNGAVDTGLHDEIVVSAACLLGDSRSRDVRIAAARVLGAYADMKAVDALVSALGDDDFGVVYHAEQSLVRLTGVRHNRDAQAWRTWLATTDAPFALRGRLDAELEPPKRLNWWQRWSRSMKRTLARLGPDHKNGHECLDRP